jgi:hypothetical protein
VLCITTCSVAAAAAADDDDDDDVFLSSGEAAHLGYVWHKGGVHTRRRRITVIDDLHKTR